MKYNKMKNIAMALAAAVGVMTSCSKDDSVILEPIAITLNDTNFSIEENPTNGQKIGEIAAKTTRGTITYSLSDQSPTGAMAIDTSSGEITVANASLFDFETTQAMTAKVNAVVENITQSATITITITDSNDTPGSDPFVTTWETTSANESITIPTQSASFAYNYTVDWGDGSTSENASGDATHSYATAGTYTVKITGKFPAIYFNDTGSNRIIKTIEKWGNIRWESMLSAFKGCSFLNYNATDIPDLSQVTTMESMFEKATSFDGNINSWDVSNVTQMNKLFARTNNFDQPLSNWDVSNVTTMRSMFSQARSFNQDLNNWDVSNVTDMIGMFHWASGFNGNIGSWNTEQVTSMRVMFSNATAFNQSLNNWNVSSVTDMSFMFNEASVFNGNISNWNTNSVTNAQAMFQNCSDFDQDISSWDVSNVTNIGNMFFNATSFNQPIGGWDVSSVTDMIHTLNGATAFDQSLGTWNLQATTRVSGMLNNTGLSIDNYDATLNGWGNATTTHSNLTLSANNLTYSLVGETGRNKLINDKNWTITGDMKEEPAGPAINKTR